jgi:hypothetical protein
MATHRNIELRRIRRLMNMYGIGAIAGLLVAMVLTGCAHNAAAPLSATAQGDAAVSSVSIGDPTSPDGILALSKRLTAHRHALFSASQGKYTYFAGGRLIAEYEISTGILRISSLEPGQADKVCIYSPRGMLYVDPDRHPDGKAFAASCNQLIATLNDDLSQ